MASSTVPLNPPLAHVRVSGFVDFFRDAVRNVERAMSALVDRAAPYLLRMTDLGAPPLRAPPAELLLEDLPLPVAANRPILSRLYERAIAVHSELPRAFGIEFHAGCVWFAALRSLKMRRSVWS